MRIKRDDIFHPVKTPSQWIQRDEFKFSQTNSTDEVQPFRKINTRVSCKFTELIWI